MSLPLHVIGPYRILEELGKGAMGRVYRGEGESGVVAIKVLHPHLVQESEEYLDRFRREATLGRLVSHPNVVRTLGFDTIEIGEVGVLYGTDLQPPK